MPEYSTTDTIWLTIGFLGQAAFTSRFLVQWLASERERNSVVPGAFWWLSLLGGLTLLSYAIHKRDPVIIVGQSCGLFIYIRNIFLSAQGRKRLKSEREQSTAQNMLPPGVRPHLADLEARADETARKPVASS